MMRLLFSFLALAQLLAGTWTLAAEAPIPPAPTQWVTDTAGFLSAGARATLNQQLRAYERQSGHQIIVWIGQTTGDTPIEDWAVRAFEKWRVGRKGLDDGIAMFIMAQDRKIRIEVGYGLEDKVPDITANQVIQDMMVPRIRTGDRDGAVMAGLSRLIGAIDGKAPFLPRGPTGGEARPHPGQLGLGHLIFLGLAGLIFFILFLTNPGLAIYLLYSIFSGGRGGGFSGGSSGEGGGFSGGGGRSGGGGATGSW